MAALIIVRRADWDFIANPSDDLRAETAAVRVRLKTVHRTLMQRVETENVPEG